MRYLNLFDPNLLLSHLATTLFRFRISKDLTTPAGDITLDEGEKLLAASSLKQLLESMAKYLVNDTKTYSYVKLSEAGVPKWTEEVIKSLKQSVSTYTKAAEGARAFLTLCQQCGLEDGAKVSRAGLAVLLHDRQLALCELSPQDRWWFRTHKGIKELQNCSIFRCIVSEWAKSVSHSDDFDEDEDVDDEEEEEVLVNASVQSHEEYLNTCSFGSASWKLCNDFDGLFALFEGLCKLLARTTLEELDLLTVKSIVSMDEDVKEQLRAATEASGVQFPEATKGKIEMAARIESAARDLTAVLAAADVCGFENRPALRENVTRIANLAKQVSQTQPLPKKDVTRHWGLTRFLNLSLNDVALAVASADNLLLSELRAANCIPVSRALAEAKDLYEFLKDLLDEDLLPLQESMETHSDELLRPDTIFALLEVQRFFKRLVGLRKNMPFRSFANSMTECVSELRDISNLADKLAICSQHTHGLQNLYKNLSKREEVAAEKIRAAMKEGTFKVSCNREGLQILLSYSRRSLSKQDLIDLRARAMTDARKIMMRFAEQVDVLLQACGSLETLREEGFYWAREQSYEVSNPDALPGLQRLERGFQDKLRDWREKLKDARAEYPELSFVYSKQFWLLADLLQGSAMEACEAQMVLSMLSHIQGKALSRAQRSNALDFVRSIYAGTPLPEQRNLQSWFQEVGKRLVRVLQYVTGLSRERLLAGPGATVLAEMETGLNSVLEAGKVRSVHARSREDVLRMALAFYGGAGCLPRAHEMLFCSPNTSWPQLDAFLSRCRHVPGLYCILHVERLTYKMQHRMVERIHSGQLGSDYRLVLVAMCSSDHVTEVHSLTEIRPKPAHALSPEGLQKFVRHLAPHLVCVVSDDAGCGKTEMVRQRAFALRKAAVTVPLSGPLNMGNFIERLLMQKWRACDCLHLDIGPTHELDLLDDILVQISFFGCVEADSKIAVVPRDYTFVELANLSTRALRDLTISILVTPSVARFDINQFCVCPQPRSPVQVVCKLLEAFENQSLPARRVTLDGEGIQEDRCRELLSRHIVQKIQGPPSYALLNTVLRVLANQFISFCHSAYFDPKQLKDLNLPTKLRTQLLERLLETCLDFTTRAVTAGKLRQRDQHTVSNTDGASADDTAAVFEGMVRWSDTKPLLLFNEFDRQTLSMVYREEQQVPEEVRNLFLSQAAGQGGRLPNFQSMDTKELEMRLGRIILQLGQNLGEPAEGSSYVVSPDNFIKMIWIALRVQSRVPVIIMGETGCGKTSLIRHLAKLLSVEFRCLNVHAGTSAEDIIEFVEGASASNGTTWAFLDEINTCDHMGLATEILCHRRVLGKPLPENVVMLAACNPYRLKKKLTAEVQRAQAQLSLVDTSQSRKQSNVVYCVQELPEAWYDYLYDFGFLGQLEEESYIKAMVEPIFSPTPLHFHHNRSSWRDCLTELISFSQAFTAENQPDCLLSLRDVKRCVKLIEWFRETMPLREKARAKNSRPEDRDFYQNGKGPQLSEEEKTVRCVLNALAVSYHCRLPTYKLRNAYRAQIAQILAMHGRPIQPANARAVREQWEPGNIINWLLREEMLLYLRHMTLPEMTATNNALLENVFVMMVCVLNRIPIFAVGKPGNSKSLSLRILNTNLRGKDSEEELWRSFPRIYVISYQGSEVSTSEGITRVFQKAQTYKNSIANDALVLVHFDEIGLAEASPNNPLKVLHAHLEPGYPKDRPDFAVVGLSNFPLDAAKMNRGIALVRPPPQKNDLVQTAKKICQGTEIAQEGTLLNSLAEMYCKYYQDQPIVDFHGLRDFYALVKTLATTWPRGQWERSNAIYRAIEQNFGGIPPKDTSQSEYGRVNSHCAMWELHHRCLGPSVRIDQSMRMTVVDMLEANLRDKHARHLMLVCSGEVNVALTLVQSEAEKQDRKLQIMMGSTFSEDQSDHYSFGLLKRVVLSMERGDILVMRALDSIHGSLYDMLNMSYTSFGSKRHCRIALGDTDIFAQVHDNFRCVVLQDAAKLSSADAAFLNRFEKHHVSISDMVTNSVHRFAVKELEKWVHVATKGPKLTVNPNPQSLFVGWGPETAASLINHIVQRSSKECSEPQRLVNEAWKELIGVVSVDGMLRATELSDWAPDKEETHEWRRQFFAQPQSLQDWLLTNGWQNAPTANSPSAVRFAVVLTTSPIQVDLDKVLSDRVPAFQCLPVDALTSELDLTHKLEEFNEAPLPPGAVLVLQLRADSPHVELLRHRCSELRKERRALLLLHGSRRLMMSSGNQMRLRLSFQTGWAQVFLERLVEESSYLDARLCVEMGLEELIQADGPMPFQTVLKGVLSECFWYIKYPATQAAAEHVKEVTKVALNDPGLLDLFEKVCLEKIQSQANTEIWWHKVIREMQHMPGHSSFSECIEAHVRQLVRGPAAVLVFLLEKTCALKTLSLYPADCPLRAAWFQLCEQRILPQLSKVPAPTGPEFYPYLQHLQLLRVPFSSCFAEELDSFRSSYFEHKLHQVHHLDRRVQDLTKGMEVSIEEQWLQLLKEHQEDYAQDLAALRLTAVPLPQEEQRRFLRPIMQGVTHGGITELHQFLWRHQGTLQLALRQLAAIPSTLRDLDRLLDAQPVPVAENQLRPNMARMMCIISAHACGALHPTATTLAAVAVDWLPSALRVLSAAKSCLEHRGEEIGSAVVELSALNIMTELSQKMERMNLADFWRQVGLVEAVRSPQQLSSLVENVLKVAEEHMTPSAFQRFQRFAHQRLLEHGVSEGVLRSVISGRPAVATAMLLRELVQSAVLKDPACFLTLQTGGGAEGNNPLRALDQLAQKVLLAQPARGECRRSALRSDDIASSNNSFPADAVSTAVELLKQSGFNLAHVAAAALLRLAAQRAAEAVTKEDDSLLDDGLEDVLAETCNHPGGDAAGFIASLLRGSVLREARAGAGLANFLTLYGLNHIELFWLASHLGPCHQNSALKSHFVDLARFAYNEVAEFRGSHLDPGASLAEESQDKPVDQSPEEEETEAPEECAVEEKAPKSEKKSKKESTKVKDKKAEKNKAKEHRSRSRRRGRGEKRSSPERESSRRPKRARERSPEEKKLVKQEPSEEEADRSP
eukprot:s610_g8.t2